jgi:TolB-like protein/Tfp pilus assembly protein PilF
MQWTLAYAAAAYTLLHGAEMVSNALHWPELVVRATLVLLVLGLPIAVLLAWYHGFKAQHRISGPELSMLTVLLIIAGSVLWAVSRNSGEGTKTLAAAAPPAAPATREEPSPPTPRTSIAVLPFVNLTGDDKKEYMGDGMATELINTLSMVQGMKVPARTSSFAYKGRNTDARQIARDLGVATVLEGQVQGVGDHIRITAQLVNADTGLQVWSEKYDRKFTDLFKLQDDLVTAIVQALKVNLNGAPLDSAVQAPPTQDVEAYQLYLQGTSLLERPSPQALERAKACFQQALARDPKFARAYAGIAVVHLVSAFFGKAQEEENAAAEQAARQALALDPNLAYAEDSLANVTGQRGNLLEAEAHYRRALMLDPNDGLIRNHYASLLLGMGHLREALQETRNAVALAPTNPSVVGFATLVFSTAGLDAEALKYESLANDLGGMPAYVASVIHAAAALRAGRYAESVKYRVSALTAQTPSTSLAGSAGAVARASEATKLVFAALADPTRRAAALAARARLYPRQPGPAPDAEVYYCGASVNAYALLGALDMAYDLWNQCLGPGVGVTSNRPAADGDVWSPEMRPFRRDARFQALVTRWGGMMQYWQKYGPPDDCDLTGDKLACH